MYVEITLIKEHFNEVKIETTPLPFGYGKYKFGVRTVIEVLKLKMTTI